MFYLGRHGDINQMEGSLASTNENITRLAEDLSAERERSGKLTLQLAESTEELNQLRDAAERAARAMKNEVEKTGEEVMDLKRQVETKTAAVNQAEGDARSAREHLREEVRKAEVENKSLRDSLRKERDLLEKTMREHSAAGRRRCMKEHYYSR